MCNKQLTLQCVSLLLGGGPWGLKTIVNKNIIKYYLMLNGFRNTFDDGDFLSN